MRREEEKLSARQWGKNDRLIEDALECMAQGRPGRIPAPDPGGAHCSQPIFSIDPVKQPSIITQCGEIDQTEYANAMIESVEASMGRPMKIKYHRFPCAETATEAFNRCRCTFFPNNQVKEDGMPGVEMEKTLASLRSRDEVSDEGAETLLKLSETLDKAACAKREILRLHEDAVKEIEKHCKKEEFEEQFDCSSFFPWDLLCKHTAVQVLDGFGSQEEINSTVTRIKKQGYDKYMPAGWLESLIDGIKQVNWQAAGLNEQFARQREWASSMKRRIRNIIREGTKLVDDGIVQIEDLFKQAYIRIDLEFDCLADDKMATGNLLRRIISEYRDRLLSEKSLLGGKISEHFSLGAAEVNEEIRKMLSKEGEETGC